MEPLVFEPYFRPQIWGQRRLERLGKRLPSEGTFGESWEISAHAHHVSRVAEGPMRGRLLDALWEQYREEFAGGQVRPGVPFPLLIKYLDCHDLLSVQVHPDDEAARRLLGDPAGKTEAWVVLDAEPGARIYAGLQPGVSQSDLARHLDAGTVAECLHQVIPQPGDCLLLPAGTVHAAGGGLLLAEVQQSSDATFRLFDWNRLGPDGKPRPLHRREAFRSIDWSAGPVVPQVPEKLAEPLEGAEGERLVGCAHFVIERYRIQRALSWPPAGRMGIGMLVAGSAELAASGAYRRSFGAGQTVLIPASAGPASWRVSGPEPAVLLAVSLP